MADSSFCDFVTERTKSIPLTFQKIHSRYFSQRSYSIDLIFSCHSCIAMPVSMHSHACFLAPCIAMPVSLFRCFFLWSLTNDHNNNHLMIHTHGFLSLDCTFWGSLRFHINDDCITTCPFLFQ